MLDANLQYNANHREAIRQEVAQVRLANSLKPPRRRFGLVVWLHRRVWRRLHWTWRSPQPAVTDTLELPSVQDT